MSRKTTQLYLTNLFRARFPFVYIPTWEESRIIELIISIANSEEIKNKRDVFIWSCIDGINKITQYGIENTQEFDGDSPIDALTILEKHQKSAILILKDVHPYLNKPDHMFIRKIRNVANSLKNDNLSKNVVIVSPVLVLPVELQKDITVVDFDLPSLNDIRTLLNEMIKMNKCSGIYIDLDETAKENLCKAAQGLTLQEAENAFARAMVTTGQLTEREIHIILEEKCQVIKKTGILEFINTNINMNDVGGLGNLKKWLLKRNNAWSEKAQKDYNLPFPKGVLITGIAGCGKSLTAKAISATWKLPLLRLDVGRIYDKWLGNSEKNIREAIQTAEAVSPSILWIDEIEKGFSRGNDDDETTQRVFGTFLTWMQEKTKPVFVIATANNISGLPPEMLRKGRFDEIFFVDLPTKNERKIIFHLHLKKMLNNSVSKGFIISDDLLNNLVELTEGFGGAEIEQIVVASIFEAFSENRTLEYEDLYKTIKNVVPLSVTQSEQILAIRRWANERAISATAHDEQYNYDTELSEEEMAKKEFAKKNSEYIKKARGGRTIDF